MKFNLTPLLISLALPFTAATTTYAAPPAPATVETILSTNGAQQSLESTLAGVETRMRSEINRQLFLHNNGPITPYQKSAIDKAAPQVTKVMQDEMGWNKMKQTYIRIYQDNLSQEEATKLAALYKDPSFIALMQKVAIINQQSAQAIQARLPAIQQRIEPILEKAVQEAITGK